MSGDGRYPISDDFIYLRPITHDDTDLIVKWRNDPTVKKNFLYSGVFTRETHEEWMRTRVDTGSVVQYIVVIEHTGRPVGSVYLRDVDSPDGCAEFGIFIGEADARGIGIGTRATILLAKYAREVMGLKRVFLRVLSDNAIALKCYKKSGYIWESEKKDVVLHDGRVVDLIFMSYAPEGAGARAAKKVSFVIPCFNSERTLPEVVSEINAAMDELPQYSYEIILVDDNSSDGTMREIRAMANADERVTGIALAKNFGQHAALMAGYGMASGEIIVSLDDDGQTPACEAGKLIRKIEDGFDVVYAAYDRKMHSFYRNLGSRLNGMMARAMLGKPKELFVSSYYAMKRYIMEEMLNYRNCYPYVIGLVLRSTGNICNVSVSHKPRHDGISGYTFIKLISLWMNGFTSFSVKPLRVASYVGAITAFGGFIYLLYIVISYFVRTGTPEGWSSLMAVMLLLGGFILLVLGLIGEYIGRIYMCSNSSPQYVIKEIAGIRTDKEGSERRNDRNA